MARPWTLFAAAGARNAGTRSIASPPDARILRGSGLGQGRLAYRVGDEVRGEI